MKMQFIKPSKPLSGFIQYYFIYEIDAEKMLEKYPTGMTILPNTYGRMGIFFSKPTYKKENEKLMVENPLIGISGFYTKTRLYFSCSKVSMLIIGFRSNGLQRFLKFPLSEINNQNIDVKDIFSKEYEELLNKLYSTDLWEERINIVEQLLLKKLKHDESNHLPEHVIEFILQTNGTKTVKEIAAQFFISERTLRRKFIQNVGINPKLFSKIVRFQKGLKLISENNHLNIGEISYELDYFDQAHFIHDFASFYGESPKFIKTEKRSILGEFYDKNQALSFNPNLAYI